MSYLQPTQLFVEQVEHWKFPKSMTFRTWSSRAALTGHLYIPGFCWCVCDGFTSTEKNMFQEKQLKSLSHLRLENVLTLSTLNMKWNRSAEKAGPVGWFFFGVKKIPCQIVASETGKPWRVFPRLVTPLKMAAWNLPGKPWNTMENPPSLNRNLILHIWKQDHVRSWRHHATGAKKQCL